MNYERPLFLSQICYQINPLKEAFNVANSKFKENEQQQG